MLLEPVNTAIRDTSLVPGDLLDDLDAPVCEHLAQLVTFLVLRIEVDASHISYFVSLDGGRLVKDLGSTAVDVERLVLINGVVCIVPLRSSLFDKRCLPQFVRALRVVCLLPMMVYLFDNLSSLGCAVGKELPAELLLAILLLLVIILLLFLDVCLGKSKGLGVRLCSHILHPVVGTHVHVIARRVPMRGYLGLFDGAEGNRVLLAVDSVQRLRRIIIITY